MSDSSPSESALDPAAYVDCVAIALDLPIDPAFRSGVIANFERIQTIAQLVLEFPLPETITPAPVFEP